MRARSVVLYSEVGMNRLCRACNHGVQWIPVFAPSPSPHEHSDPRIRGWPNPRPSRQQRTVLHPRPWRDRAPRSAFRSSSSASLPSRGSSATPTDRPVCRSCPASKMKARANAERAATGYFTSADAVAGFTDLASSFRVEERMDQTHINETGFMCLCNSSSLVPIPPSRTVPAPSR